MPLRAGLGVPKRRLEGLEGLMPGKRQASTPIKSLWALVPLPAGLGVPKRRLEGLERLKPGKRQASTPI